MFTKQNKIITDQNSQTINIQKIYLLNLQIFLWMAGMMKQMCLEIAQHFGMNWGLIQIDLEMTVVRKKKDIFRRVNNNLNLNIGNKICSKHKVKKKN